MMGENDTHSRLDLSSRESVCQLFDLLDYCEQASGSHLVQIHGQAFSVQTADPHGLDCDRLVAKACIRAQSLRSGALWFARTHPASLACTLSAAARTCMMSVACPATLQRGRMTALSRGGRSGDPFVCGGRPSNSGGGGSSRSRM